MKTNLSISILLLFFAFSSFGQTEPRLYKKVTSTYNPQLDDFWVNEEKKYEYDQVGNQLSEIIKSYDIDGELSSWVGFFNIYDNDNNILKHTYRRYNEDVTLWITEWWEEYSYNENGCLILSSFIYNSGQFAGVANRIEYEVNDDCQFTKKIRWREDWTSISAELYLDRIEERTYFQDGISYEYTEYVVFDTMGTLLPILSGENHFNSLGNIEERLLVTDVGNPDYEIYDKTIFTYDSNENHITSDYYRKYPSDLDWDLWVNQWYHLEYDDQNRITKSTYVLTEDPDSASVELTEYGYTRTYQYLCENLIETEIYIPNNTEYDIKKYDYYYEGINECFEIENVMLEMSVFPNPSVGEITIESPLLESGNTQIMVFDINGNLLLGKNEFRREKSTTVDLNHLPNGMYIVQLMNQDHFTQNKVMILN